MNQAIAKQDRPVDLLKATINAPSVQEQFKNALGEHKDTFVASLIDLYTGDRSLQTCKPSVVIAEALRAATLRLPLVHGTADLVTRAAVVRARSRTKTS